MYPPANGIDCPPPQGHIPGGPGANSVGPGRNRFQGFQRVLWACRRMSQENQLVSVIHARLHTTSHVHSQQRQCVDSWHDRCLA